MWKHEVKQANVDVVNDSISRAVASADDMGHRYVRDSQRQGKREQAIPLTIVDKEDDLVPRAQDQGPRWSMSSTNRLKRT